MWNGEHFRDQLAFGCGGAGKIAMQPTQEAAGDMKASALNHLIETTKDGENGYAAAARDCSDASLKHTFMQYSRERRDFAVKLQRLVEGQGKIAEVDGTLGGVVHRGWINLKSTMSTRDNLAVLEECERGEDHAVKQYLEALEGHELGSATALVQQQCNQVKKAHEEIVKLRDKRKASMPAN
jgi:uncharacterized protein (TIGR02284 family)